MLMAVVDHRGIKLTGRITAPNPIILPNSAVVVTESPLYVATIMPRGVRVTSPMKMVKTVKWPKGCMAPGTVFVWDKWNGEGREEVMDM